MQSIKKETLTQQVSEGIKAFIENNELKPGDKLPFEKEFIVRFGVSRTVVREALKSLEVLGVVELKPGDGIYVAHHSLKDITDQISFHWQRSPKTMKELLAVRKILEMAAIEMAINDYEPERIAPMEAWILRMEEKIRKGSVPAEEDFQFHRALFKASGNEMLFQLSDFLYGFFENAEQEQQPEKVQSSPKSLQEHKEILHWIHSRDIVKAKESLQQHLLPLEDAWGAKE
ncbi:FadR/GntR family transcriptional regulator [Paenibacillus eucommiae]|uniref:GntR family transcriptional repressor for pyruvate dehydrogenase complex n=1 Tax=Paenibacillus eucommiae TaxID=1355755 RepID=A0ABS4J294_9BACL|nr:FadR/GntR family transcriptional regulator [Paenibacillus eucommiae]MBP1993952.1 GntR family transcriptional repressor for pyruvate dehydrogenase complex [Paenibacillus eucommiae]